LKYYANTINVILLNGQGSMFTFVLKIIEKMLKIL
jgi:hypothetical protein